MRRPDSTSPIVTDESYRARRHLMDNIVMTSSDSLGASDTRPDGVSVVLPVLNERDNLRTLHGRIVDALKPLSREFEVIYVDDGSTDDSWDVLREVAASDDRIKLIRLRKNFGQTSALAAGLEYARYPVLVTLDADLQNDPADI